MKVKVVRTATGEVILVDPDKVTAEVQDLIAQMTGGEEIGWVDLVLLDDHGTGLPRDATGREVGI